MTPKKHIPSARPKKGLSSFETIWKKLRSVTAKCWYILLAGTLSMIVLFSIAITPERYDLQVGDIAYTTITASKDVVDELATERNRDAAVAQVEPSYLYKEGVTADVMHSLASILTQANTVQQYGQKTLEQYAPGEPQKQKSYVFTTAEMEYAKSLFPLLTLADYQINTLMRASDEDMLDINNNITTALENTMNTTIREGYVSETIQYLQQIIGYKTDMDLLQNVVTPILRKVVQPNMVIDQDATAKLQQEARDEVEPVIYKQGQNIVVARERVTANQLDLLRSLGLLDDADFDLTMYVGGALLVLFAMMTYVMIILLFNAKYLQRPKKLAIQMIILNVTLALCIGAKMINLYLPPVLLGAMMMTALLSVACGAAATITLAIVVSALIAGGNSTYGTEMVNLLLTSIISGILVIFIIRRKPYRQQLFLAGVLAAISNIGIILVIGFMTNTSVEDVFTNSLWSAAGALVASLLCVGFNPIMESVFHLATQSKLLELSNPNHPLLRRLLMEAPGTYHHSIIVANLAEAAAEAIGANPLLARAGAYYHDIGKLKRPLYFKENQMGENPHEHTNPYVSAAILTAHTRDGLMMAQQNHLPQEIQDIIIEHHGDTPVMYFYHKALQQANGQPVDISDFRYDGRRPHIKESAIIMLADTVEAAVRSMPDPTPKAIEAFIERLVRGKLEDGQLSHAPVTLSDIDRISEAFSTVLNGVFHERIEYPAISPEQLSRLNAPAPRPPQPPAVEESPVEAIELTKVPEIDAQDAEHAAAEAVNAGEQPAEEVQSTGEREEHPVEEIASATLSPAEASVEADTGAPVEASVVAPAEVAIETPAEASPTVTPAAGEEESAQADSTDTQIEKPVKPAKKKGAKSAEDAQNSPVVGLKPVVGDSETNGVINGKDPAQPGEPAADTQNDEA
ncbi:MAG: HDIG domain-containing protein [Eubacteriales bacterium]|nr:HDIG domain-containing protein [Eubacteriales bacterium]